MTVFTSEDTVGVGALFQVGVFHLRLEKNAIGSKMHNANFLFKKCNFFFFSLSKKIYIHILYTCRNVVHINSIN